MLLFAAFVAEQGLGGMPDRTRALALIREAAERGNADASALLAQAEELGLGVMRDETAAINRYEKLSRFVSPAVWFRLGLMLQEGRGAKADPCRARQLLHGAAEHAAAPVQVARSYLDRTGPQMRCPRS